MRVQVAICVFLAMCGLSASMASAMPDDANSRAASTQPKPPNVIILLADDLGYGDLGSYGHPSIRTPQLDRIAAEGQRWTDFYVVSPVCSPSRGALMTGKYPVRSGLYGVKNSVVWPGSSAKIPSDVTTLPQALKKVGYDTAMFGKWHLGDRPEALPTRFGFDQWLGLPHSNDMDHPDFNWRSSNSSMKRFLELLEDPDSRHWNASLLSSRRVADGYQDTLVERPVDQSSLTERYTRAAVSYINARSRGSKPFFIYIAYTMPHVPLYPNKKFIGKSLRGKYGDTVEEIDWSVGEIRSALEASGLDRDTLIFFGSDNGPATPFLRQAGGSAGLLRGGKGTTFEGGMRVPGIFWWPGTIKPGVISGIGTTMDLYAVITSLAGVDVRQLHLDSIDLGPALFKRQPSPRTKLLYYNAAGELLGYRSGKFKVLLTQDGYTLNAQGQGPLLFNLEEDPSEAYDSSNQATVLERMLGEMRAHGTKKEAPIFDQEQRAEH